MINCYGSSEGGNIDTKDAPLNEHLFSNIERLRRRLCFGNLTEYGATD